MIRLAKKEDINNIYKIGSEYLENFNKTYDLNSYISNPKYIILVNEEDNINSFLIMLKNLDSYELELIVVSLKYRNLGLGTKLISYFIDNYIKKDETILLEVSTENEIAIKLYKSFGFEIINTRKKYYKDADAYVMKKVI